MCIMRDRTQIERQCALANRLSLQNYWWPTSRCALATLTYEVYDGNFQEFPGHFLEMCVISWKFPWKYATVWPEMVSRNLR